MADLFLSKSDYLDFRLCPSYCWLKKHQIDLVPRTETASDRRRIYFGNQLDRLARELFPGGVAISAVDTQRALEQTNQAIADPDINVIFQATVFAAPGFLARADILVRDEDAWHLIEVKSACKLDDDHFADATFQLATFEAAGFTIKTVSLLHLDSNYRRSGEVDTRQLFVETDCTDHSRQLQLTTRQSMDTALETLRSVVQPTTCQCHLKTRANHCPTFNYFHPEIPEVGSIYEMQRLTASKLARVLEYGAYALGDWPDQVELTEGQQHQLNAHRHGTARVDHNGLREFLDRFIFPLYFLDYETSNAPVPMFDGNWPYQQLPFQYSLHVLEPDGTLEHREFLAINAATNPALELAMRLKADIGDCGSIVVWNKSFEKTRNQELAIEVTELAEFLLGLNDRMMDLMEAVAKHHYVHPGFSGSSSIKYVLPVVAPDLSYKGLMIQDGAEASEQWLACILGEIVGSKSSEIFDGLRQYCCLDTLAMVRIWQHLTELSTTT